MHRPSLGRHTASLTRPKKLFFCWSYAKPAVCLWHHTLNPLWSVSGQTLLAPAVFNCLFVSFTGYSLLRAPPREWIFADTTVFTPAARAAVLRLWGDLTVEKRLLQEPYFCRIVQITPYFFCKKSNKAYRQVCNIHIYIISAKTKLGILLQKISNFSIFNGRKD